MWVNSVPGQTTVISKIRRSSCCERETYRSLGGDGYTSFNLNMQAAGSSETVAYRVGGGGGGIQPPPPKFRSFDKVEPDCKLNGKCIVFLFQHPN